jgi:hypothetical protein
LFSRAYYSPSESGYSIGRGRVVFTALLAVLCIGFSRQNLSFTQHGINELAGKCVTAQIALKGLKGSPNPGEKPDPFKSRIRGYLDALDSVDKALAPLRHPPTLVNLQAESVQRWQQIVSNAKQLSDDVASAHTAWKAYPTRGDKAKLGPRLLEALSTVQSILSGLRDARP